MNSKVISLDVMFLSSSNLSREVVLVENLMNKDGSSSLVRGSVVKQYMQYVDYDRLQTMHNHFRNNLL